MNWGRPGFYVLAHRGDCQAGLDASEDHRSPCAEQLHRRKAKGIYAHLRRLDAG